MKERDLQMKAMIKNELRLSRRMLLIWMGIVLMLCGFAYFEYLSLQDSLKELAGLIDSFPKILMIMFGVSESLDSALGWYGCIYFWVTFLTNSYAVYLGISCIAKEGAQGTAEYLFTKPISRRRVVVAKTAASACNLLILAVFSGLCNYFTAVLPLGGLERKGAALTTTIDLFLTELFLFALTLFLSALRTSYKGAVRVGAGLLVLFYGMYIVAGYTGSSALDYLTPIKYFDVHTVAKNGLDFGNMLIAAGVSMASVIAAGKIWNRREPGL